MQGFYATYAEGQSDLEQVIRQMAAIKSPALVVANTHGTSLYTSRMVFETYAGSDRPTSCSQLPNEGSYSVRDLNSYELTLPISSPGFRRLDFSYLFEQFMDSQNFDYGFLRPTEEPNVPRIVLVITRREEFKYEIVGTNTICVCTGPDQYKSYNPKDDGKLCFGCNTLIVCTNSN